MGRPAPPTLALIGCGAIAESFYLPALRRRGLRVLLVDPDPGRREALARALPGAEPVADPGAALAEADAAIVAAPPEAHHPLACEAIAAGVHLLVEKPLAASAAEARDLVRRAAEAGTVLAVNQTRRLFAASIRVRDAIAGGRLGRLRSIRYVEGQPFNWPTASGFYFRSAGAPRGVLLDRGAHVLDLVAWWLGGRPRVVCSLNDSFGGPEAVADVVLAHGDCRIEIRLSWLRQLANRFEVIGDAGRVEGEIYNFRRLEETGADGRRRSRRLASPARVAADFAPLLLDDFLAAAAGRAPALVPGAEVVDSLELLDECYRRAERFELPWCVPEEAGGG